METFCAKLGKFTLLFTLCIHIEETLFEVKSTEIFFKNSKRNQFLFNFEKGRSSSRIKTDFFLYESQRDYLFM